jgi:DAK2 domain fusion protein YloV
VTDTQVRDPSLSTPGPGWLPALNGQGLKELVKASRAWLKSNQQAINALNVFPVPDGDTGTNMLLTMESAWAEVDKTPTDRVGQVAHALAHGALMGARGNSGVILSQLWRGFARSLDDKELLVAADLAPALQAGSQTAYKGVIKPVEGTILTVAREVAEACAEAARDHDDLAAILDHMVVRGRESVARTPSLLPILKQAGVVDSGGQGYLVILEGMLRHLCGEPVTVEAIAATAPAAEISEAEIDTGDVALGYAYDVQCLVVGENLDLDRMRADISAMGRSALIVGDAKTVKVHVHVPDYMAVLNYVHQWGRVREASTEDMAAQYQEYVATRTQRNANAERIFHILPDQVATVAVAPGEGLARVFQSLGVAAIVPGGQTMNPSTEQFLRVVEQLPTDKVLILPNNGNVVLAARQAAELAPEGKQVVVLPTKTVPQGIAAQLAFNAQYTLEANAAAMEHAARHIQTGEVTTATRDVEMNGVQVKQGRFIGLLNDMLSASGDTVRAVVWELLEQMGTADREIVTLYYGNGVGRTEAESLAQAIRERYSSQEIEVVEGGQPHYYYILSAE